MWKKIGVELELDVRESGAVRSVYNTNEYDIVSRVGGRGPISVFYHMVTMIGVGAAGGNASQIEDPICEETSEKMKSLYITDARGAMNMFREMMKHVLDQAYTITGPQYNLSVFWWPWLKNYSGESMIGYFDQQYWAAYTWLDEDLKKSMGY